MQRGALRRFSRRAQPGRVGAGHLLHTSVSATSINSDSLPVDYLSALHDSIHLSQAEQDAWTSSVLSVASLAQDAKSEARREALHEANRRMEQQRQEQEQILARREADRRARVAEKEEQQRREDERLRREQEEAERRRREERAAAEEALRRAAVEAAEAERRRQERLRPCVICMDDSDLSLMAQTPCGHWSCKTCLKEGFEASIASRSRYQCCQQHVPVSLIADLFEDDFTSRYDLMILELTTPNPVYCADPACAAFIPPANYFGPDSASCDHCLGHTCRHCRSIGHAGRGCTMDQATEQVRALAAVVGWKTCPACTTMVERRDGCLHMTCLCGAEFCYRCGGYWRECSSRCAGQYF